MKDMQFLECVGEGGAYQVAKQVRFAVFVEEQGFAADIEIDEYDKSAVHIALRVGGEAVACARLCFEDDETAKIGRVAVLKRLRGKGYGRAATLRAVEIARERGAKRIYLHSQMSAQGFYGRLGFLPEGDVFDEEGVEHITMVLKS
jgi:predicted GNAT family N-acyltransferase